jgi:S1-C subfamily serine protease
LFQFLLCGSIARNLRYALGVNMNRIRRLLTTILLSISLTLVPVSASLINSEQAEAAAVKLNKTSITLYTGDTYNLKLNGAADKAKWSSGNKKIAAVSAQGKITGVKSGTTTITAILGTKKYKCSVTIKNLTISSKTLKMQVNTTKKLSINGAKGTITWKSADTDIAAVSPSGAVKAKSAGTVLITGKTSNKNFTCTVTVTDKNASAKLTAEEVYAKCSPSTVQINTNAAIGSGFFLDNNRVITNYHVIEGATSIKIQLQNGKTYDLEKILGYDKDLDIAILSVPVPNEPIKINKHGISIGETVYAIGSSLGFTDTFTNGIVTNASRIIENEEFIQTNAAITHGNSGGPLLNAYGEVMGINTMQYVDGQNLNFAININQLSKVNVDKPISAQEFYDSNKAGDSSGTKVPTGDKPGNDSEIMYEDTTKSKSPDTCQSISSGLYVYGSLALNDLDYYKFTVNSSVDVYLAGLPDLKATDDISNYYFAILDINGEVVAAAAPQTVDSGQLLFLSETLQPGTYYVAVLANPDKIVNETPYIFTVSY